MIKNKKTVKIKPRSKTINKFSDSEFHFDDCMICQGMKEAEEKGKDLRLNELKKLFKKANEKQKDI